MSDGAPARLKSGLPAARWARARPLTQRTAVRLEASNVDTLQRGKRVVDPGSHSRVDRGTKPNDVELERPDFFNSTPFFALVKPTR